MVIGVCPDTLALQQLALGRMSPAEVERLAAHCEQCERCLVALQQLRVHDTLVEAMSAQATAGDDAPSAVVVALIDRLKALRPVLATADDEVTRATLTDPTPSSDDRPPASVAERTEFTPDVYNFLRPAQEPGELGRLGNYRILKVLGQGGMGVVFLAEDVHLQRTVALKAMLPEVAQKAGLLRRDWRQKGQDAFLL